jgi:hypothetical protein
MRKKLFIGTAILSFAAIAAFNLNLDFANKVSPLTLANIEALASESDDPCRGNPFYSSDQALTSVRCLKYPLVYGYKLSCVDKSGRCCDPADQTKCE